MDRQLTSLDWSLIQAFLAVAESGSLSAAARAIGVSQPTIGRQIRLMEDALGVQLFLRQPRGFALSETGAALMGPARAMRDAAGAMALTAAGHSQGISGVVRVTASVAVSHYLLPPILAEIRNRHPEIELELVSSDTSENLLFREADIALRMYRPKQLNVVTQHLGDIPLGVYGAKTYLEKAGVPKGIPDLFDHALVGYDRSELIICGMRERGLEADRHAFTTRCDNHAVYWEMVRAGCGLGFGQVPIGDYDPLVERVLPELPVPPLPIWLTAHEAMRQTPRLRRVWDMLAEGLKPHLA
ncbi:LysR family transcriptional regulator [Actibacterium lipolyticum]|uniref:HTH-type transcriptional regulator CysL n=1 Tax=Actibacterium lipolyticum TaxID=1524263 RepID=A0A238KV49_9RHOB|nr:LysR family transcriptional regulator [Actibacterium lipolyticum]SMX46577.1 HTH-type transcriptional regulator CysL [Actibacterium lipolyticum]